MKYEEYVELNKKIFKYTCRKCQKNRETVYLVRATKYTVCERALPFENQIPLFGEEQ